jgi:hypothetical protein
MVRKDQPHTILNHEKSGTFHASHFLVWCGVIYFHIFTTPFEFFSRKRTLFYPVLVISEEENRRCEDRGKRQTDRRISSDRQTDINRQSVGHHHTDINRPTETDGQRDIQTPAHGQTHGLTSKGPPPALSGLDIDHL